MILTGFSRCQARMIGRVSPPPHKPPVPIRILHDYLVPGNENRPAFRPRPGCRDRLPRHGLADGLAGTRRRSGARQGQWLRDPPERRDARRGGISAAARPHDPPPPAAPPPLLPPP